MTEQPKTKVDPEIYHRICALVGDLNHMYQCLHAAGDALRKAGDAMEAAGSVCSDTVTNISDILDRLKPEDTFNPTEE